MRIWPLEMVQNRHQRLHLWPKVLLNCSDMSYATFIPTIVSSVLPLAASRTPRMRKSSNFDRKPAFDENIAVRNGSKQPERLHLWPKMLVNCSDVFYATFIPNIVYYVLALAASMSQKAKFWAWWVDCDLLRWTGANSELQSQILMKFGSKSKFYVRGWQNRIV